MYFASFALIDRRYTVTNDQVLLVQQTFKKVMPISEVAADLFYNRLFELDPSLRALFKGDMKEQGRKLMQMLGVAVVGLSNPDSIVVAVQDLGRRHVGYGVVDSQYDTVRAALLWTLGQGLGSDFTPEAEAAWAQTFDLLASLMKGAAHSQTAV
jgi:hemoglobin-like flavoprotein